MSANLLTRTACVKFFLAFAASAVVRKASKQREPHPASRRVLLDTHESEVIIKAI